MIMEIHSYGITDTGCLRPSNEDQYLMSGFSRTVVANNSKPRDSSSLVSDEVVMLAVADGVGGHSGGSIASEVAVESLSSFAQEYEVELRHSNEPWQLANLVRKGVLNADEQIRKLSRSHPSRSHMATTLTCALVNYPDVIIGHAGDSSCFISQKGRIKKLTADHTVAEAFRSKNCAGEHQEIHPSFKHMLWNCLGGKTEHVEVETHALTLEPDGWLILATDGLTNLVTESELQQQVSAAECPKELCHRARQIALDRGGNDNITIVACHWNNARGPKSQARAREKTTTWLPAPRNIENQISTSNASNRVAPVAN